MREKAILLITCLIFLTSCGWNDSKNSQELEDNATTQNSEIDTEKESGTYESEIEDTTESQVVDSESENAINSDAETESEHSNTNNTQKNPQKEPQKDSQKGDSEEEEFSILGEWKWVGHDYTYKFTKDNEVIVTKTDGASTSGRYKIDDTLKFIQLDGPELYPYYYKVYVSDKYDYPCLLLNGKESQVLVREENSEQAWEDLCAYCEEQVKENHHRIELGKQYTTKSNVEFVLNDITVSMIDSENILEQGGIVKLHFSFNNTTSENQRFIALPGPLFDVWGGSGTQEEPTYIEIPANTEIDIETSRTITFVHERFEKEFGFFTCEIDGKKYYLPISEVKNK